MSILSDLLDYETSNVYYKDFRIGPCKFKRDFGLIKKGARARSASLDSVTSMLHVSLEDGNDVSVKVRVMPFVELPAYGSVATKPTKIELPELFEAVKVGRYEGRQRQARIIFGSTDPDATPQAPVEGSIVDVSSEAVVLQCAFGNIPFHPENLGLTPNQAGQWSQINKFELVR